MNTFHENRLLKGVVVLVTVMVFILAMYRGSLTLKMATEGAVKRHYQFLLTCNFKEVRLSRVTAYCPCEKCCGIHKIEDGKRKLVSRKYVDGKVAINVPYTTILSTGLGIVATDTKKIPRGSIVIYKGKKYLACDEGEDIKGWQIDIFTAPGENRSVKEAHKRAGKFGVRRNKRAYILTPKKNDRWRLIQAFRRGN